MALNFFFFAMNGSTNHPIRYFLVRHGKSLANEADVIISHLENGVDPKWGLSPKGIRQAKAAGARLATLLSESEENIDTSLVRIYTSPFSRCRQTAQHIAEALGIPTTDNPSFQQTDTLAERNFGSFELQSSQHYESIWEEDAKDPSYVPGGSGESCKDVVLRFERFLEMANKDVLATLNGGGTLGNCVVIVVGHGDGLSCGASRLLGSHLENHRQHGLENCGIMEIRKK